VTDHIVSFFSLFQRREK